MAFSSPEGQTPQKRQRLWDQAGLPRDMGARGSGVRGGRGELCERPLEGRGSARPVGGAGNTVRASCSAVPFLPKWEAEDTALGMCRRERACAGVSGHVCGARRTAHPIKCATLLPSPDPSTQHPFS